MIHHKMKKSVKEEKKGRSLSWLIWLVGGLGSRIDQKRNFEPGWKLYQPIWKEVMSDNNDLTYSESSGSTFDTDEEEDYEYDEGL